MNFPSICSAQKGNGKGRQMRGYCVGGGSIKRDLPTSNWHLQRSFLNCDVSHFWQTLFDFPCRFPFNFHLFFSLFPHPQYSPPHLSSLLLLRAGNKKQFVYSALLLTYLCRRLRHLCATKTLIRPYLHRSSLFPPFSPVTLLLSLALKQKPKKLCKRMRNSSKKQQRPDRIVSEWGLGLKTCSACSSFPPSSSSSSPLPVTFHCFAVCCCCCGRWHSLLSADKVIIGKVVRDFYAIKTHRGSELSLLVRATVVCVCDGGEGF